MGFNILYTKYKRQSKDKSDKKCKIILGYLASEDFLSRRKTTVKHNIGRMAAGCGHPQTYRAESETNTYLNKLCLTLCHCVLVVNVEEVFCNQIEEFILWCGCHLLYLHIF